MNWLKKIIHCCNFTVHILQVLLTKHSCWYFNLVLQCQPLFQKTFFIQSSDPKCTYSKCCCCFFFVASGDLEQLLQSWLWSGKLSQQHIPLRLPLLSSVRWSPSSHNHFWCLSGSRVQKCVSWLICATGGTFRTGRPTRRGPRADLVPITAKTNSAVSCRQDERDTLVYAIAHSATPTNNTNYFVTVLLQQIPAIKSTASSTVLLWRPFLDAEIVWCPLGVPLRARALTKSSQ